MTWTIFSFGNLKLNLHLPICQHPRALHLVDPKVYFSRKLTAFQGEYCQSFFFLRVFKVLNFLPFVFAGVGFSYTPERLIWSPLIAIPYQLRLPGQDCRVTQLSHGFSDRGQLVGRKRCERSFVEKNGESPFMACERMKFFKWDTKKTEKGLTFHSTGCLMGMPIMVYYYAQSPHNWVVYSPVYPKQPGFFSIAPVFFGGEGLHKRKRLGNSL